MTTQKGIIVGTGRAGTYLHFGALTANGAEILAFVDVRADAAKDAAERLGVPRHYDSLEKALDAERPDFVSICTNVESHAPLAKLALSRGVHVLVEKPMTSTLAEAEDLGRAMQASGKNVSVVHNHKFYPGLSDARALIAEGRIGRVLHVHREMTFFRDKIRMMEADHWAHRLPGGRLFEANPHNLYLLYGLLGRFELVDIRARKTGTDWPHAKIDEFVATFRAGAATASLKMGMNAENAGEYREEGGPPNYLFVVGSRGSMIVTYQWARTLGAVGRLGEMAYELPRMIRQSVEARFKKYPDVRDAHGDPVNIGLGSGHYYYMERYLAFLRGEATEPPVPWDEAFFVEEMNERMGHAVDRALADAR